MLFLILSRIYVICVPHYMCLYFTFPSHLYLVPIEPSASASGTTSENTLAQRQKQRASAQLCLYNSS